MALRYNLTGSDRKRLVTAISEITGAPAKYLGAPSFAYLRVVYSALNRQNCWITSTFRGNMQWTRR